MAYCQCFYHLLNLTRANYSSYAATKNRRKIQLLLHPDKCNHTLAKTASQAINMAYKTIGDEEDEMNYRQGMVEPSLHSCEETQQIVQLIQELLSPKENINETEESESHRNSENVQDPESESETINITSCTSSSESSSSTDEEAHEPTAQTPRRTYHPRITNKRSDPKIRQLKYKERIIDIENHTIRRGKLKLLVNWRYNVKLWEHFQYVASKHPDKVRIYFQDLKDGKPVVYKRIHNKFEELANFM